MSEASRAGFRKWGLSEDEIDMVDAGQVVEKDGCFYYLQLEDDESFCTSGESDE